MIIAREDFSEALFNELLPLTQKCFDESTQDKGGKCAFVGKRDFAIEPDIEFYRRMAASGVLLLLMVRDEGKLIGYAIGFTISSPHHKKILCGYGDSIYLEPEYRAHGAVKLLKQFEDGLKSMGAKALGWPVSQDSQLHHLLCAMGFVGDDIVMEKILCA